LIAAGNDGNETYSSTYTTCSGYWGYCRQETTYHNSYYGGAGFIIVYEIVTWSLYYAYRRGAYRYADYMESQKNVYY